MCHSCWKPWTHGCRWREYSISCVFFLFPAWLWIVLNTFCVLCARFYLAPVSEHRSYIWAACTRSLDGSVSNTLQVSQHGSGSRSAAALYLFKERTLGWMCTRSDDLSVLLYILIMKFLSNSYLTNYSNLATYIIIIYMWHYIIIYNNKLSFLYSSFGALKCYVFYK